MTPSDALSYLTHVINDHTSGLSISSRIAVSEKCNDAVRVLRGTIQIAETNHGFAGDGAADAIPES